MSASVTAECLRFGGETANVPTVGLIKVLLKASGGSELLFLWRSGWIQRVGWQQLDLEPSGPQGDVGGWVSSPIFKLGIPRVSFWRSKDLKDIVRNRLR